MSPSVPNFFEGLAMAESERVRANATFPDLLTFEIVSSLAY